MLCGLLTVLALTPPVRAAVSDWFGFGGVEVRTPSAVPSEGAEVPDCGPSVSLGRAERRAGFAPLVPEALGAPDAVTVSGLPRGRFLVSLCWRERGRTIRLDQFPARLDVTFTKRVREHFEWLSLGGEGADGGGVTDPALWFPRPHLLGFWLVDADGHRFTRKERTAGPTLLWMDGGRVGAGDASEVTLRLEGRRPRRGRWRSRSRWDRGSREAGTPWNPWGGVLRWVLAWGPLVGNLTGSGGVPEVTGGSWPGRTGNRPAEWGSGCTDGREGCGTLRRAWRRWLRCWP
ncbi:hypothetical protein SHIRM173S_11739 [Streptomyces hirsutus]